MRFMLTMCVMFLVTNNARAQSANLGLDGYFPAGTDFCYGRIYDAVHLRKNLKQTVTALFLGGRNAQRRAPHAGESNAAVVTDKTVYVTLTVHFRERPLVQTWPGVCNTNDANGVHCSIIPHKDQDTVDQGLSISGDMAGYTLAVTSDWQIFRNPPAGSVGIGPVASSDRVFHVQKLPVSSCKLSSRYFSSKGATDVLVGSLP
jgi:hypothetical protein